LRAGFSENPILSSEIYLSTNVTGAFDIPDGAIFPISRLLMPKLSECATFDLILRTGHCGWRCHFASSERRRYCYEICLSDLCDHAGNTYGDFTIAASWYLTDIIAGFEIWGGFPGGSSVEKFTVVVD
jgi:hypothetical protein